MNPTNQKLTDLFAPLQTLFNCNSVASIYWAIACWSGWRIPQPLRFASYGFASYAIVIICVLGSLGCQRNSTSSLRQGRIVGGSMAPHFLGDHFEVQCKGCSSEVVADFEQSQKSQALICPFCGTSNPVSDCRRRPSDRVKIELDSESISRWDVVAFELLSAHQAGIEEAGIKRVVGLPGETIEIREGNLWLNGNLIRKTIDQQKRTRVLIHDSRKTNFETALWQPVDSQGLRLEGAGHRFEEGRFKFDSQNENSMMRWFEFCNQRNYEHKLDEKEASDQAGDQAGDQAVWAWPIEDSYGYNQSLWRNLNVVDEIFVSLKLATASISCVGWKYGNGGTYEIQVDFEDRALTLLKHRQAGQISTELFKLPDRALRTPEVEIEFSTIDGLAVVLIAGVEVARFELESPAKNSSEAKRASSPLQIGIAFGATAVAGEDPLSRVRVWRDIYYLPADEAAESQTLGGSPDGYLLLGDNQPISIDSRHWPQAGVPREQLIGKVRK